jgi:AraC-like DNA-binding protein
MLAQGYYGEAKKDLDPGMLLGYADTMQRCADYIDRSYAQELSLESLARQFGVSVSFLSHEFVRYTGRSVYDYVLHRRVQMAKAMINEAMPLNEVAYQCGFNDYSNFLRVFSKMAGMSPSAFRKRSKEAQKDPKRTD